MQRPSHYHKLWDRIFPNKWVLGLFLVLLFGIPRFILVLKSYVSGQSQWLSIVFTLMFFTPLLFDWFLDAAPGELGFSEELLFYSWQWGVAKPSEKLFRTAARRLSARGIDLRNTIYIGNDMLNDILPARSAGFQTALFAGDKRSLRLRRDDPRCANLKPDMILTDLIQLAELLDIR